MADDARPAPASSLTAFGIARRDQIGALLGGLLTMTLLGDARAAVPKPRMRARRWIERQDEIARALAAGQIEPRAWMTEVERLGAEVDLAELLAEVDHARISPAGEPSGNDPRKRFVRFVDASGTPRRLGYGAALFDFAPRNVITPHGHKHMASAHIVIAGSFRIRNFDRLRDEDGAMVIRPTRDYVARRGHVSTMSSQRDNIHWFVPVGGPARTFDVILSDLDPGQPSYEIKAVDPVRGRRLGDGSIVAPIIGFDESSRLYTSAV